MADELSDFDIFWMLYPRKRSKIDAEKAWRQTEKIRPPLLELLERLATLVACDYSRRQLKHIPYPGSWLRSGGWEDSDSQEILEKRSLLERYETLQEWIERRGVGEYFSKP